MTDSRVTVPVRHGKGADYYKCSPPDDFNPVARTHPVTAGPWATC